MINCIGLARRQYTHQRKLDANGMKNNSKTKKASPAQPSPRKRLQIEIEVREEMRQLQREEQEKAARYQRQMQREAQAKEAHHRRANVIRKNREMPEIIILEANQLNASMGTSKVATPDCIVAAKVGVTGTYSD